MLLIFTLKTLAVMKQCQMDQRKQNLDSAATIAGEWCIDDDDGGNLIDLEDPHRPRHSEILSALWAARNCVSYVQRVKQADSRPAPEMVQCPPRRIYPYSPEPPPGGAGGVVHWRARRWRSGEAQATSCRPGGKRVGPADLSDDVHLCWGQATVLKGAKYAKAVIYKPAKRQSIRLVANRLQFKFGRSLLQRFKR